MSTLRSARLLFALGAIVPLALVAFAVVLTTGFQIAACPLCIVQRGLFLAIALVSLGGLLFADRDALRIIAAMSGISLALTGAAIAGYQIYLQRNPFAATCGDGSAWWERLVTESGQALPLLFKADGLCSAVDWSLLGLSIVDWSLLSFLGLALLCVLVLFSRQAR